MRNALEDKSDDVLRTLVGNLKRGALNVVNMGDRALVSDNPKECPPAAGFWLNMVMITMFEKEFLRRGLNFDGFIGEEFRAIIDMWNARENE